MKKTNKKIKVECPKCGRTISSHMIDGFVWCSICKGFAKQERIFKNVKYEKKKSSGEIIRELNIYSK